MPRSCHLLYPIVGNIGKVSPPGFHDSKQLILHGSPYSIFYREMEMMVEKDTKDILVFFLFKKRNSRMTLRRM